MNREDLRLIAEKQAQLDELLSSMEADCWIAYCREGSDPSTVLYVGYPMVGESAFFFTKSGEKIAIVANYDRDAVAETEVFDEVLAYELEGIEGPFCRTFERVAPTRIALNFSTEDFLVDGLTYGLFRRLRQLVADRQLEDHVVSAESILLPLRARKTPEELRRIERAIQITHRIFDEIAGFARPGMTEIEVGEFIHERQVHYGAPAAFGESAIVAAGHMGVGHRFPGPYELKAGDVMIVDMGVSYRSYTSDFTRTFYFLRDGETKPPVHFQERFTAVRDATHLAIEAIRPGVLGWEIDKIARDHITDAGLPAYPNALGHQIGRRAHDGGGLLSPLVPRYGDKGKVPLEVGNVYTVEPFLYGRTGDGTTPPIGLEENVVVEEDGARVLTAPQSELICIG